MNIYCPTCGDDLSLQMNHTCRAETDFLSRQRDQDNRRGDRRPRWMDRREAKDLTGSIAL